jgi:hypothetical protein
MSSVYQLSILRVIVNTQLSGRHSRDVHNELLGAQESIRILQKELSEKDSEVMMWFANNLSAKIFVLVWSSSHSFCCCKYS